VSGILVVNAGSTSLKLHLVGDDEHSARITSFADAPGGVDAVAHRVVHGGAWFREAVVIDDSVREQIRELVSLAPLHNAPGLHAIEEAERAVPDVPHIAVFDTSFHRSIPEEAALYAIPALWRDEWGIRRYGFHGLSVQWCTERVPELLGCPVDHLVVCHLGGGSSVTAVVGGRSVDTTMGFTPLEGVPMTTRSGSIDPGALLYVLREHDVGVEALDHTLNSDSGMKGLAGGSGDMRELERRVAAGEEDAQLALDVWLHRLAGAVASMAAAAGGLDALVFTAGIGEGSALVRTRLCDRLAFLGIEIDARRNDDCEPDCDIAADAATARVLVVRAREELVAARSARQLLRAHREVSG
jgi:acetate kinase